jgi:hypothetical protein
MYDGINGTTPAIDTQVYDKEKLLRLPFQSKYGENNRTHQLIPSAKWSAKWSPILNRPRRKNTTKVFDRKMAHDLECGIADGVRPHHSSEGLHI